MNDSALRKTPTHLVLTGLGALLLGAGGWPLVSLCVGAACVALAFAWVVFEGDSLRPAWAALLLAAAAGLVALQLVPLGEALEWISPRAFEVRQLTLGTGAGPVSYEVAATQREVAKLLMGAMALWVVGHQVQRYGTQPWLQGIAVVAALSITVAAAHALMGVDELFGYFPWRLGEDANWTTLVNENHSAAFLVAVGMMLGSWALAAADPRVRTIGWVGAMLALALAASEGSRGGQVGVALALVALAVAWTTGRAGAARIGPFTLLAWFAVALCGVAAVSWFGFEAWLEDQKLDGLRQSGAILLDHFWVGTGRGAFGSVFVAYNEARPGLWFHFPENLVVQQVAELGVPAGAVVSSALLGLPMVFLVRSTSRATALVAGALALLVIHDLLDFSLETPAVALLACMATGLTDLGRRSLWTVSGFSPTARATVALLPSGLCGLALWGACSGDLSTDMQRLGAATDPDSPATQGEIVRWARRHPANPFVWARAATALQRTGDMKEAIEAVNAVLFLAPAYPDAHLLSARLLRRAGYPDQSLLAYRRAWELAGSASRVGEEVLASFSGLDDRLEALPRASPDSTLPEVRSLLWLAEQLLDENAETAAGHVVTLAEAQGVAPHLQVRYAKVLAGLGRFEAAMRHLRSLAESEPAAPHLWRDLLAVAMEAGAMDVVREVLPRAEGAANGDWSMLRMAVKAYNRIGDHEGSRRVLAKMQSRGDRKQRRKVELLRIQTERLAGNLEEALRLTDVLILSASSEREGRILRVHLLLDMGRHAEARMELDQLGRAESDDPRVRKLESRLAAAKNGTGR